MRTFVRVLLLFIATWSLCHTLAPAQFAKWTKDPRNPVLSGGGPGSWNYEVLNPFVLYNTDSSRYEMWFAATSGTTPWTIGFATSKDGASWSKYPSAVLSPDPGAWDQFMLVAPCVIRQNNQYKMWYSAFKSGTGPTYVGYATSPDGIHWTKYASNPVLGPGTSPWEAGGPIQCSVMPITGGYKMWYVAWKAVDDTTRIGYATSTDGLTWQRDTVHNPVFNVGAPGQWDARSVGYPIVLFFQNTYFMWYQGQQVSDRAVKNAGLTTSSDGIVNWTRYSGNPVLTTSPGSWDQTYAELATVVRRGDTLHAWYDGESTVAPLLIGHATIVVTDVPRDGAGELPRGFALEQNYPNPFNPTTVVSFQVPVASDVQLVVYDFLGRKVAVLVNERKAAGSYESRFDASGLSSGVYVYRLTAGPFVQSLKMVVLK